MSKTIKQSDIESISSLTQIANRSTNTDSVILVKSSSAASVVGTIVGGAAGAAIATGGIGAIAGTSLGAATLGTIGISSIAAAGAGIGGVAIGAGALGASLLTPLAPIAIVAALWYLFSGPSEDEKKLNARLKEAVEAQNRVIEKIKRMKEELEAVYEQKVANLEARVKELEAKILELLEINEALIKEITRLKTEYNLS